MTVRKLKEGQLSCEDVSQMMAEIFKKMREDSRRFSDYTEKQQLLILHNSLVEIRYVRTVTGHALINIFLDEYEKSVKLAIEEVK